MSDARRRVYVAIRALWGRLGIAPTVREIGAEAGLSSSSTVCAHLHGLQRDGFITFHRMGPRTIRLTDKQFPGLGDAA